MDRGPDDALALLADMGAATDPVLRRLARSLAGRVVVTLGRAGPARSGGVGRLAPARLADGGDLDVDSSLDVLLTAAASGAVASLDDLRSRRWARPTTALCLLVDRSGSMGGARLAAAAVAAAAVAYRAPGDYSVIAFAEDAVVVKAQDEERPVERVVDEILALRGHGTTNLALALGAAAEQLGRSRATQRAVLLLSDCRATAGEDPSGPARLAGRLLVAAPAGDAADARSLVATAGGRCVELAGPSQVPEALARLMAA